MAGDKIKLSNATNIRRRQTGGLLRKGELADIADGMDQGVHEVDESGGADLIFGQQVICKILALEAGDNKYKIAVYEFNHLLYDPSRDLNEADISDSDPLWDDAVLLHIIKGTGHSMEVGDLVLAQYCGETTEATPRASFATGAAGNSEFEFPIPSAPYQVLMAVPKTGGGYNLVFDYPRIHAG